MVDAGLDLSKTEPQSLELLRSSGALVALQAPGVPVGINKRFLGVLVGTEVTERREAAGRPRPRHRPGLSGSCRPTTCGLPAGRRRHGRGARGRDGRGGGP